MDFKFLTHGFDTAEICYYLDMNKPAFDLDKLVVKRDGMEKKKRHKGALIELGGKEFLLKAHGSGSGYPFIISNPDSIIQFGEFNNPSFSVKFSSDALWHKGLDVLHKDFLSWSAALGLVQLREESLSRIDVCFDYASSEPDFDEKNFITCFRKDRKYRGHRKPETLAFGTGTMLRMYDKAKEIRESSQKEWFYDIWGQSENVWRIEWQFRNEMLRQVGITTLKDMDRSIGFLLNFFCNEHTSIRLPSDDSNSSRWPIHPLWLDLQERVKVYGQQKPSPRQLDMNKIPEKIQRNIISMMGYLKHIAALSSLYEQTPPQSYFDISKNVRAALNQLHDSLTWQSDVQARMDQERLKNV
ncbi:MAG TPA: hypothetical protein DCY07_04130 [Rhodospirillaceae bacterium]|nr:hypothetical protein [Rhodospirillaceae bacterium]